MKKIISILLSLLFALTALVLVSCGGNGIDGDEFENVAVSSDGILTWTKLNRAKKYEILKGKMGTGADKETVTECSFDLKNFNLKTGEYDITLLGIEDNNELGETVEMEFAIYEMVIEVVNGEYSMRNRNYSDEYLSLKGWEDADGTITNYIKPQFYSDMAGATYTSLGKDIKINGENVWALCKNSDYSGEVASQTITGLKKGHNYYYIKLNDKNGTFIKGYKIDFYILDKIDVKLYSLAGEEIYSTSVWERESIDVATIYEKVAADEYIAYGSDILERDSAPVKAEKGKSFRVVSADEYNVLKHFDFSNGVLTKKKNHDCSGVDSLVIPAKIFGQDVVKIGDGTTPICNVKTLTLPEGIKEIADYAFANTSLETVNIPDSVTIIGSRAFNGTSNLKAEKYGDFDYIGNWLVKMSSDGSGELKPTTIGIAYVFESWQRDITLPDSLRYFDDNVFSKVDLSKSRYVEDVGQLKYIGNWLVGTYFSNNSSAFVGGLPDNTIGILKHGLRVMKADTLTIPSSVRYIDKDAFAWCSIGSITGTDLIINEDGAFLSKDKTILYLVSKNATQVVIPDTVTYVQPAALANATSLKKLYIGANVGVLDTIVSAEVTVSPLNKTYFEKSGIIYRKDAESNRIYFFNIPKNITGNITLEEGISSIPSNAFENCTGITGVIFPAGLESIDRRAFRNCTSLTNITLPEGLDDIGLQAFDGCTSLASVTIPESVTEIEAEAFGENVSVTFKATDNWYYIADGPFTPVDVTDEAQLKKALKSNMRRSKTN